MGVPRARVSCATPWPAYYAAAPSAAAKRAITMKSAHDNYRLIVWSDCGEGMAIHPEKCSLSFIL